MTRLIFVSAFLFAEVLCQAQATFIRTYDQPADLVWRGSCMTADDGLILTGNVGDDGFLLRLDQYGNVLWLKRHSSIGVNEAGTFFTGFPYDEQTFEDVLVRPNGDLFVVGSAKLDVQGPTGTSMLFASFDSLGAPTWGKTISTSHGETLLRTALYDANTALMGGGMSTLSGAEGHLYTVDLDSGDVQRTYVYDDLGYALLGNVARSPDGAVLVSLASNAGYGLQKLTDTLSTIWQGCWTMASWMPVAMAGTPSGCTVAAGAQGAIRYGPTGIQQWAVSITSTPTGGLTDLVMRPNGNVVFLGHTDQPDPHSYLVELDSTGAVQWSARYGALGDTLMMTRLHLLSDGSLRMVGTSGASRLPTVIAVDALGQLDACTFPPPALTFGALTPIATASGNVSVWLGTSTGRHEEFHTSAYPVSTLACAGSSSGYLATGRSFLDLDQDGLPGTNEPLAPWQLVQVSPNNGGIYTASAAPYLFAPPDSGTYVLSAPLPSPLWQLSSDSASYTVHLGSLTPTADSLDFGWAPVVDTTVINTSLVSSAIPCIGLGHQWVDLLNQGTTTPDLLITCTFDTLLDLTNATPPPDSVVGQAIHWHADSLGIFQYWQAELLFDPPGTAFVGDTVHCTVSVSEIDSLGNTVLTSTYAWHTVIACAYDPNDKQVEPAGDGAWGGIGPTTEWLTYNVRFQNTGNDTAQTVVIEDDLSAALQWNSLQVLAASHPLTGMSVNPTGKATFRFDDILLPDSNVNEPASQGFVRFRVKPLPGLAHLTTIDNNAGIFFDLNPPVITNTVRNTIIDCAGIGWEAQITAWNNELAAYTSFMDTMPYTYQWIIDGLLIPGANTSGIIALQNGEYQVIMTDAYGCSSTSSRWTVISTGVASLEGSTLRIIPNPFTDQARVILDQPLPTTATVLVLDAQGRVVRSLPGNGTNTLVLQRGDLAPGLYVLRVDGIAARFVVE